MEGNSKECPNRWNEFGILETVDSKGQRKRLLNPIQWSGEVKGHRRIVKNAVDANSFQALHMQKSCEQ